MPRIGAHPREVDAPSSILYRTAKQMAREGRSEEARAVVEAGIAAARADLGPSSRGEPARNDHQGERVA
jgi:hypothetical protein